MLDNMTPPNHLTLMTSNARRPNYLPWDFDMQNKELMWNKTTYTSKKLVATIQSCIKS
jgi:hypothetical protein